MLWLSNFYEHLMQNTFIAVNARYQNELLFKIIEKKVKKA